MDPAAENLPPLRGGVFTQEGQKAKTPEPEANPTDLHQLRTLTPDERLELAKRAHAEAVRERDDKRSNVMAHYRRLLPRDVRSDPGADDAAIDRAIADLYEAKKQFFGRGFAPLRSMAGSR